MSALVLTTPVLMAAAGYSLIYLLLGGGLCGAILIFIIAKMMAAIVQTHAEAQRTLGEGYVLCAFARSTSARLI